MLIDPPNPLPQISVELPFSLVADTDWNRGTLNFVVIDSVVRVRDETGKELGTVCAAFGGYLEVHINRGGGQFSIWRLSPDDAWRAVAKAVEEKNEHHPRSKKR